MMAASVDKTLVAQDLQSAEQVGAAFAEVRAQAEADLRGVSNEKQFEEFKNHWLGRKSGVVTKITDNWLKQAPTDLKKLVGQEFNKFKTALEELMEERRVGSEAGAGEGASGEEPGRLSLSGVWRAVGADITFCDFTGTIEYFVKQFFGPSVKTRFRPSYFPFTEPSVEFDVSCVFCGGRGTTASGTCGKCKGAGWIELFGAGMVDPAVYGFVGYDPKKVSGFAFGIGIDRLAMLKYGIDDIQAFFQDDVRVLKQFP